MHEEEEEEEETEEEGENDSDPDNSMRQQNLISIQNKTYKMFLDIMHYWLKRNERNLGIGTFYKAKFFLSNMLAFLKFLSFIIGEILCI